MSIVLNPVKPCCYEFAQSQFGKSSTNIIELKPPSLSCCPPATPKKVRSRSSFKLIKPVSRFFRYYNNSLPTLNTEVIQGWDGSDILFIKPVPSLSLLSTLSIGIKMNYVIVFYCLSFSCDKNKFA